MYLNELKTGMQLTTKSITVDKSRMLAFAEEFNPAPIHTDEDYAASTKFGQLLSPGMFSFLLVWAKYIEQDFFGDALIAGKSTKVEWDAPVFAGDTLTGHAEIIDMLTNNVAIVEDVSSKGTGIPHFTVVRDTQRSCRPGLMKLLSISFLRLSG